MSTGPHSPNHRPPTLKGGEKAVSMPSNPLNGCRAREGLPEGGTRRPAPTAGAPVRAARASQWAEVASVGASRGEIWLIHPKLG